MPALQDAQLDETLALAQWLAGQKSHWPAWTIKNIFACHRENVHDTFISVTLEKRIQKTSPTQLLKDIKDMISRPLKILINDKEYGLKQFFHPHLYDQYKDINNPMCVHPVDNQFKYYAPKVPREMSGLVDVSTCTYCRKLPVMDKQISSFFIRQLFYCEQVAFNESEFNQVGHSIHVPGIKKVFHDLDYQIVNRDTHSFVHVCADQASYVSQINKATRVELSVYLFVLVVTLKLFCWHYLH